MSSCYLYILESTQNNGYYIGSSKRLDNRLHEHNTGLVKSTRNKGPWIIKFFQKYNSEKEARHIEHRLKKFRRRDIIEKIISDGIIKINPGV
ncbi:MAG: GIY-YIG nuclease family protein [Patescibacteria group bacterium]